MHGLPDYTFLPAPDPVCSAKVYRSAGLLIPNGQGPKIPFDQEAFNYLAMHSKTVNTDRLTATVQGLYLIMGQVSVGGAGAGAIAGTILMNDNIDLADAQHNMDALAQGLFCFSVFQRMSVGDYVNLYILNHTGADVTVVSGLQTSTLLMATWLSP